MKCPKCGYNSFEYLDNCKKCNNELSGFKASHGIRAVVLPFRPLEQFSAPDEEAIPDTAHPSGVKGDDDGMFSWENEHVEAAPTPHVNQAEEEPFSFDLDLPVAPQEEEAKEFALEDLGGEGSLSLEDAFSGSEAAKEESAPPQESPFGEFSFDDLYKEKEAGQNEAETGLPGFPEPTEAGIDAVEGSSEFSFDALEADDVTLQARDAAVPAEPPALEFGEFPFQEISPTEDPGEADVDSMGLSAEEYESLFGEPPPKKKSAAS